MHFVVIQNFRTVYSTTVSSALLAQAAPIAHLTYPNHTQACHASACPIGWFPPGLAGLANQLWAEIAQHKFPQDESVPPPCDWLTQFKAFCLGKNWFCPGLRLVDLLGCDSSSMVPPVGDGEMFSNNFLIDLTLEFFPGVPLLLFKIFPPPLGDLSRQCISELVNLRATVLKLGPCISLNLSCRIFLEVRFVTYFSSACVPTSTSTSTTSSLSSCLDLSSCLNI